MRNNMKVCKSCGVKFDKRRKNYIQVKKRIKSNEYKVRWFCSESCFQKFVSKHILN